MIKGTTFSEQENSKMVRNILISQKKIIFSAKGYYFLKLLFCGLNRNSLYCGFSIRYEQSTEFKIVFLEHNFYAKFLTLV